MLLASHMPADRQIILLIYSVELEKLKNLFPIYCNSSNNEKFILVLIMTWNKKDAEITTRNTLHF